MDLEPEDTFISLSTLEKYIEKYPEDAEKWREFLDMKDETHMGPRDHIYSPTPRDPPTAELVEPHANIITPTSESPVEHYKDGCLLCKKTWTSTHKVPTITLICGHAYHTVCYMYRHYANDAPHCLVQECDIDTWAYVRVIYRNKRDRKKKAENILLKSFKKRDDFKNDIKLLKQNVSEFNKSQSTMERLLKNARDELIHKHLYSINHLQKDMNTTVKDLQETEEMLHYKASLRKFRKHAANIFRKYHTSFRELNVHGIIKCSWRIRGILERHRKLSFYKLGCRIYPGRKFVKDPLVNDVVSDEESSDDMGEADN
jgi:hypothetical protein